MTEEQRKMITEVLAEYGAGLDAEGHVVKHVRTSVRVEVKAGRLRFLGKDSLLASYRVGAAGVRDFVEKFWFWKKDPK